MRKNLLLTCLLTLIATLGMAQIKTNFPITLTEAEGLPGPFVVKNYLFRSEVYELDEAVNKIRLTVCRTNTADLLLEVKEDGSYNGRNSHDGISAYRGPGNPFFTMSEVRFYDENGDVVNYVAESNATAMNDGGAIAALSDKNEGTYLHTIYYANLDDRNYYPCEYHYVEFELEKEVSTFSFSIQTRSNYYKNLITYMGVTGGNEGDDLTYVPYPDFNFQMGEKVASLDELAAEGAFFVIQGNGETTTNSYEWSRNGVNYNSVYDIPGNLYMRSPYESAIIPDAASAFYLIPDVELENTYKLRWLYSGAYILNQELSGKNTDIWASWTPHANQAASITFEESDSVEGNFTLSVGGADGNGNVFTSYIGYDAWGRMAYIADVDSVMWQTSRPTTYNWAIYNVTLDGSAISSRLQTVIDEADARIEAIGGAVPEWDGGEYDALVEALDAAKAMVADPNVAAADILSSINHVSQLTASYAAVGLWVYVDSIATIDEMFSNGELEFVEAPNWKPGTFTQGAFNKMVDYLGVVEDVILKCQSLADVDAAIAEIYTLIDAFWASQLPEDFQSLSLPFRVAKGINGGDNLPGAKTIHSDVWSWYSQTYFLDEPTDAIRLTTFKNHSGRKCGDWPFLCLTEVEIFDLDGNRLKLSGDDFYAPTVAEGSLDKLADGDYHYNSSRWHSTWSTSNDPSGGKEPVYLDITLPEEVAAFSIAIHGRGNGYDDTPTDFAIGFYDTKVTPDDFPVISVEAEDDAKAAFGEQITDLSQITDDGFYALVGLRDCAPQVVNKGKEKVYSGAASFGNVESGVTADCAYTLTRTGDEDGSFYVRAIKESKYVHKSIATSGLYYTSMTSPDDVDYAGKFIFANAGEARAKADARKRAEYTEKYIAYNAEKDSILAARDSILQVNPDTTFEELAEWTAPEDSLFIAHEYPGTFIMYMYNDTLRRDYTVTVDGVETIEKRPNPYCYIEQWSDYKMVTNYTDSLEKINYSGACEWKIYKLNMETPYIYWLNRVYPTVADLEFNFGSTAPGYFKNDEDIMPLVNAIAKAQAAIEAKDDAVAKEALVEIQATKGLYESVERNPITHGVYVIESGDYRFEELGNGKKALVSYFNEFVEYDGVPIVNSEYQLFWTSLTETDDLSTVNDRYKFELIPATTDPNATDAFYSDMLEIWVEDSVITAEDAANAFFIRSVEANEYLTSPELYDADGRIVTSDIGMSKEPIYPFIVVPQGPYNFSFWCPDGNNNTNNHFHMLSHGNGGGLAGKICFWNALSGSTRQLPSMWRLRQIGGPVTSVDAIEAAEGDVVSVAYYTVDGASVAAPVKGINIVKTTYANGVVKTTKKFVK